MPTNGDDTLIGGPGNDTLNGWHGDDLLRGLAGNDWLYGSLGRDTLDGGLGADRMIGGDGDDRYYVDDAGDVVVELAAGGDDAVYTSVTVALPAEVERGVLLGDADLGLYGNAGGNLLIGNEGRNRLYGGEGNDTLSGQGGNDELYGGAGDDYLVGGLGRDLFVPGLGNDRVNGWDARTDYPWDTLRVDYSSVASDARFDADTGHARAGANSLVFSGIESYDVHTGGGDDFIRTGQGNDTLDGGVGADTLIGGGGNDVYLVDSRWDVVMDSGGNDRVVSSVSLVAFEGIVATALAGTARSLIGRDVAESLSGNAQDNRIMAGGGADRVEGGSGDDGLWGGAGADTLTGGTGNDSLQGGAGFDLLAGNEGADHFVVHSAAEVGWQLPQAPLELGRFDHIDDFSHGDGDLIDLSAVDARTDQAGDQAFVFIGTDAFHQIAGELRQSWYTYDINGSDDDFQIAMIEADLNGDGVADLRLGFIGDPGSLVLADFVL
ncbi:MAG: calcium-binding protein [Burkholderiales bacterium]|nr:calcium-binding protein [Burkholderiales bacterium]